MAFTGFANVPPATACCSNSYFNYYQCHLVSGTSYNLQSTLKLSFCVIFNTSFRETRSFLLNIFQFIYFVKVSDLGTLGAKSAQNTDISIKLSYITSIIYFILSFLIFHIFIILFIFLIYHYHFHFTKMFIISNTDLD